MGTQKDILAFPSSWPSFWVHDKVGAGKDVGHFTLFPVITSLANAEGDIRRKGN